MPTTNATGWTAEVQGRGRSSFNVYEYFRAAIRDGNGRIIAYLPELGDEDTDAETVAIARLIAAAPLMLETLREIRERVCEGLCPAKWTTAEGQPHCEECWRIGDMILKVSGTVPE